MSTSNYYYPINQAHDYLSLIQTFPQTCERREPTSWVTHCLVHGIYSLTLIYWRLILTLTTVELGILYSLLTPSEHDKTIVVFEMQSFCKDAFQLIIKTWWDNLRLNIMYEMIFRNWTDQFVMTTFGMIHILFSSSRWLLRANKGLLCKSLLENVTILSKIGTKSTYNQETFLLKNELSAKAKSHKFNFWKVKPVLLGQTFTEKVALVEPKKRHKVLGPFYSA